MMFLTIWLSAIGSFLTHIGYLIIGFFGGS
jgi:hypothetical protein